jgi:signal transduction histidine kinase/DNA-binding response OmpR family regulator
MFGTFNRLGPKLILTTITFLLLLAIATSFLVTQGFHQTQNDATQRSAEGLKTQGRDALLTLTQREAQISILQFQQAAISIRYSADYLVTSSQFGISIPWDTTKRLVRGPENRWLDSAPDGHSSIFLANNVALNPTLERDIRDSAALDALFPSVLAQNPDAIATYYVNPNGFGRYYPAIDLAQLLPADYALDRDPVIVQATPPANPQRQTVWSPPYVDPVGQGLLVSASTPVYDHDQFRGITGIDVSLTRLIDHLNNIKPTPGGYAFLVDRDGHLIAAPPIALKDIAGQGIIHENSITATLGLKLTDSPNDAFKQSLEAMRKGASQVDSIQFDGRQMFLAYAPLNNVGWSLGIVAPVNEVTAQSASVGAAIRQGTDDTVRSTLLTMGIFFLLALLSIALLSRRLTQPITALVAGTRAVASGDLNVTIPVTSRDELGLLARSFNQMTGELGVARERLESWNQTLERTVEQRTIELATATAEAQEARAGAEQANKLKSQFLANMSHELRTPLNSIINFTRILSAGIRGPVNEGQVDYLNRVWQSGQHLLGLINDILDLSKIEAGRMELYKEPLQIGDLVQSVMSTAIGLTKEKLIEMRQEVEPDLPAIEADHTRVRQVLLNLLSNAAKFTEEGAITVRVRREDDELIVQVADTGIGIAPEHLRSIFEEFRQAESASNRRYEGTGLGLAICRRFVELHNGRIWAESTPGVGSTFSFSLPITVTQPPAEPVQLITAPTHPGTVILVIDDDPAVVEIVTSYLSRDEYAVHGITDSRRALDVVRQLNPAAIILDVMMPYKDGWEVLADLKTDPELRTVPVILYTIVEEQKLGFYLGASAYLTKPIDEEQLRATVARLVSNEATVLVIDDDPNAIEIVTRQLEQAGAYSVITAGGGQAGLDQIAETRPDLIILDLMMPEIDGFAVLEYLDRSPATSTIPVIVLTAKDLTMHEHEFLNQRVHGLLNKDLTPPEQLLSRVTDLLGTLVECPALPVEPKGEN